MYAPSIDRNPLKGVLGGLPPTRCFFGAESAGEFSAFARAGLERLFDRRRTKAARAAEDAAAGSRSC